LLAEFAIALRAKFLAQIHAYYSVYARECVLVNRMALAACLLARFIELDCQNALYYYALFRVKQQFGAKD
jgi:hypothetical protein